MQSYQIVSHLDVNRDNRANRGEFLAANFFFTITKTCRTIGAIASDRMSS